MTTGLYCTARGSTVMVSGAHGGIYEIEFDWLEEEHACSECRPSVYDGDLVWGCEYCGGGRAELRRVTR